MGDAELTLSFVDRDALEAEYRQNLRHGRAFVAGAGGFALFAHVVLLLTHPDTHDILRIDSEVVMVLDAGHGLGVALQFLDRSATAIARIGGFLAASVDIEPSDAAVHDPLPAQEGAPCDSQGELNENAELPSDPRGELEHETPGYEAHLGSRVLRLRNLNEAQRMQVARGSVLEDRVVLERLYGNSVWPLLLHNPKITAPEVARMARKGTMPRPLLDFIAEHEGFVRQSLVRRALLANPRLSPESTARVLRATPPRELKLVPQQTAYPAQVRAIAQRMLRGSVP